MLEQADEVLDVISADGTSARVVAPANYDWSHVQENVKAASGRQLIAFRADDVTINLKPLLIAASIGSGRPVRAGAESVRLDTRTWQAYAEQDGIAKSELLLLRAIRELGPLRKQVKDVRLREVDRIASVFEQLWQQRVSARVFAELEERRILPRRVRSVREQVLVWTGQRREIATPDVLVALNRRPQVAHEMSARQLAWQRVGEVLHAVQLTLVGRMEAMQLSAIERNRHQKLLAALLDLAGGVQEFAKAPR